MTLSAYINRCGLADFARVLDRVICVGERSIGISKDPQSQRPKGQDRHPDVLTKTNGQRPMLHRFVERNRLIVVGSAIRNVPCVQQGSGQETMPNHERAGRLLLCGERQELRRKVRAWRHR